MPAPGATDTLIGAGAFAIEGRAQRGSFASSLPQSTKHNHKRWPTKDQHSLVREDQSLVAWVVGSFIFFCHPGVRTPLWRRRSPRVCCVEDHVDDAWRPQPRFPTLPPWVGWLDEKASPGGKHRPGGSTSGRVATVHFGTRHCRAPLEPF